MDSHLEVCLFCGHAAPNLGIYGDQIAFTCAQCGARGPLVDRKMLQAEKQARAGWNHPHARLGRVAIANVPRGIEPETASSAERLMLIAEGLRRGEYEDVRGFTLLLMSGTAMNRLHAVLHRMTAEHAEKAAMAMIQDTRARRLVVPTEKG